MNESCLFTNQVFLNAGGAAFGGFVGVLVFFLFRLLYEIIRCRPKIIRIYKCTSDTNQGQENEVEGELKHHRGKRVDNDRELAALGVKDAVWEWTRDRAGDKKGDSIFYGPYSTDFTEPGLYSISFRIRGKSFTKPTEITEDVNVLELDVNCITPQLVGVQQAVASVSNHLKVARRFVRVSELAESGWHDFELRIWSDGRGIWEYRAFAFDGESLKSDNLKRFGADVRIFFDKVVIKKLDKIKSPSV